MAGPRMHLPQQPGRRRPAIFTRGRNQMEGKVKLTTLWQRRSERTGKTYFSGSLGAARILVLKDERAEVPDGADGIWTVFLDEPPQRQAAAAGPPLTITARANAPTTGTR